MDKMNINSDEKNANTELIDNKAAREIRDLAYKLFSTDNIVFFANNPMLIEYKDFYSIKQVSKILENSDMIATAKSYFDNALNTSLASLNGYMHRNTMVYRLQKIYNMIGLDIRNFNDAVILNNILVCRKFIDLKK